MVTANEEVVILRAKVRAKNNLANFLIYPPFKRFFKKRITAISV